MMRSFAELDALLDSVPISSVPDVTEVLDAGTPPAEGSIWHDAGNDLGPTETPASLHQDVSQATQLPEDESPFSLLPNPAPSPSPLLSNDRTEACVLPELGLDNSPNSELERSNDDKAEVVGGIVKEEGAARMAFAASHPTALQTGAVDESSPQSAQGSSIPRQTTRNPCTAPPHLLNPHQVPTPNPHLSSHPIPNPSVPQPQPPSQPTTASAPIPNPQDEVCIGLPTDRLLRPREQMAVIILTCLPMLTAEGFSVLAGELFRLVPRTVSRYFVGKCLAFVSEDGLASITNLILRLMPQRVVARVSAWLWSMQEKWDNARASGRFASANAALGGGRGGGDQVHGHQVVGSGDRRQVVGMGMMPQAFPTVPPTTPGNHPQVNAVMPAGNAPGNTGVSFPSNAGAESSVLPLQDSQPEPTGQAGPSNGRRGVSRKRRRKSGEESSKGSKRSRPDSAGKAKKTPGEAAKEFFREQLKKCRRESAARGGRVVQQPQAATANAPPSRFCHLCTRSSELDNLLACTNFSKGSCRKVICFRCVREQSWDLERLQKDPTWVCTHCKKNCPQRAQCHTYKKVNQHRRGEGRKDSASGEQDGGQSQS